VTHATVGEAGRAERPSDGAERPPTRAGSKTPARVITVQDGRRTVRTDDLATEEPLEIRLQAGGERRTVAITMRTPGEDFELAAGFLYTEGVIRNDGEIDAIAYCIDPDVDETERFNVVTVCLRAPTLPESPTLDRHFLTTSACGVCGKASLDALHLRGCAPLSTDATVSAGVLRGLADTLRQAQGVFEATGGLHAAGLFDLSGRLLALREDVGRHNALDKLIGWAVLRGLVPLREQIVMVSGRSSFELAQKCAVAGAPILCSVSAPSSLAVSLAERFGLTLVGFLRGRRFNVYAGAERITILGEDESSGAEVP
jgi:FdhD protein